MITLICELSAIGSVMAIVLAEWLGIRKEKKPFDSQATALWYVRARRTGPAGNSVRSRLIGKKKASDEIALGEERYLAGNRLIDDLYIDASGKRFRMYMNVQRDRIFLTVLRGTLHMSNFCYEKDKTKRLEINDLARVVIADVELEFIRKRVM